MAQLWGKSYTREEIKQYVGDIRQIAGTDLYRMEEGKAKGTKAIDVKTGSGLRFTLLPDRALDIAYASFRGKSLCHITKTGIADSSYYEPSGEEWFWTYFGGMLTTCGLSNTCASSDDEGRHYGLHGRISNTPAEYVTRHEYWDGDDYKIEVSGRVREAVFYGENLLLERKITTELGSTCFEIHDRVTNEGYDTVPLMILYHLNFGFPLLNARSKLYLSRESTDFFDKNAEAGKGELTVFQPPTRGFEKHVFMHTLNTRTDGSTLVALVDESDPENTWGVNLQINRNQFPYLFEFKMMGRTDYQLGIEPVNSGPYGRSEEKKAGRIRYLEAGETKDFNLTLDVMPTPARCREMIGEIKKLGSVKEK